MAERNMFAPGKGDESRRVRYDRVTKAIDPFGSGRACFKLPGEHMGGGGGAATLSPHEGIPKERLAKAMEVLETLSMRSMEEFSVAGLAPVLSDRTSPNSSRLEALSRLQEFAVLSTAYEDVMKALREIKDDGTPVKYQRKNTTIGKLASSALQQLALTTPVEREGLEVAYVKCLIPDIYLGHDIPPNDVMRRYQEALDKMEELAPHAVVALISHLKSITPEEAAKWRGQGALDSIFSDNMAAEPAMKLLPGLLSSETPVLREIAVNLLGILNSSPAHMLIISALGDNERSVRIAAMRELKGLKLYCVHNKPVVGEHESFVAREKLLPIVNRFAELRSKSIIPKEEWPELFALCEAAAALKMREAKEPLLGILKAEELLDPQRYEHLRSLVGELLVEIELFWNRQ